MGAGVSSWRLAQAVSKLGQLGLVSGTALDHILARRLQDGDVGGHMRRALDRFSFCEMAARVLKTYYVAGGRTENESYKKVAKFSKDTPREIIELCIVANFVEIDLAKEGHANPVGINYLEKIQSPHLPSIYGAMLAGVDYVLMGAGIPLKIPGVLDRLSKHDAASYELQVTGAQSGDDTTMHFVPQEYWEGEVAELRRPNFIAIVASNTLAVTLVKKANGRVDGFVVEGPTAGGHNEPPRGKLQLTETGEPIYGERDVVDLEKMRELGLPFWLADMAVLRNCGKRWPRAQRECRWERRLRSARNPICVKTIKRSCCGRRSPARPRCLRIRSRRQPAFRSRRRSLQARYRSATYFWDGRGFATWGICERLIRRKRARLIIGARASRLACTYRKVDTKRRRWDVSACVMR